MLATRSITFILHCNKEARRGLLIHTQPEPSAGKWGGLDAATQSHIKHSFATSRLPINVYFLNVALITLRRRARSQRKRLMRVLKSSSARSSRYAVASVVRGYVLPGIVESHKTYSDRKVLSNIGANGF